MEDNKKFWGTTILYNLAWLVSSLFVIVDVFIFREAVLDVLTAIQISASQNAPAGEQTAIKLQWGNIIGFADQGILFLGGVVAVALAIGIEYYFRKGQENGTVWKRVVKIFAIIAAVFVVCLVVQILV